uniref:Uncharacterized protein n=1 Tax=Siphoviridae sp. ctt5z12 TaxID=2823604 RepID=A0A8S5LBS8_9CAUD|nr:MAG TPA: hypothetical protein [Siphoviridae sp. ctt5z12]
MRSALFYSSLLITSNLGCEMKLLALLIWIILSFLAVCLFVSVAFAWLTVEKFKGDEE